MVASSILRYSVQAIIEDGVCDSLCLLTISANNSSGVRARQDIRKGQFIDKYVGEVITPEEADHRRELSRRGRNEKYGIKDLYLFGLDKFRNDESLDERLRGDPFEIDGEFQGGTTRFINHSCSPNLRTVVIVTDSANKQLHEVGFFALEDINRGTEFTFDYQAEDGSDVALAELNKKKEQRQRENKFWQECQCGSKNCRGYLW